MLVDVLDTSARRLFVKLDQLLPARVRERVQALPAATMSLVGRDPSLRADTLATLATACRDGVLADFGYRSHEGAQTQRTVEPVRLVHSGNRRWYLVAWDRARETWRTFRADRVLDPIRLGARVPPRKPARARRARCASWANASSRPASGRDGSDDPVLRDALRSALDRGRQSGCGPPRR